MALGSGLLFGIILPPNFNSPYKARTIQDFWHRWHMTLSRFLRDYIYIPLGGNKTGACRTYRNLFLTFLIGGLWHGANWTFIAWGALHGAALCVNRLWSRKPLVSLPPSIAWFITFLFVTCTWVVFRAQSLHSACIIWSRMFAGRLAVPAGTFEGHVQGTPLEHWFSADYYFGLRDFRSILFCIAALICVKYLPNSFELKERFKPSVITLLFTLALFITALANVANYSEFLYFQF